MLEQKTRILVIGAGYAGLLAAVRLGMKTRGQPVQVTLINPVETFVERPRLHQFAANQPVARRPIPAALEGTGVEFVRAAATAIDASRREVTIEEDQGSRRLAYDYLIYTAGSTVDREAVPGVREYAFTLNPSGEQSAEALRSRLPELDRRGGRLAVVGGGPTGIEAAAEFAEAHPALHVTLVTQGKLGGLWGGAIQAHIQKVLARLGVAVVDEITVERVEPGQIVTSGGGAVPFDLCLWAGGFVAPALAREAGLAVNARGQVLTDLNLRSISDSRIYAAGDSAQPVEAAGMPVRMAAYTAVITGAHVADSLYNALNGRPQKPLNFAYLGQGIALGRRDAVAFNNFPDDQAKAPLLTGRLAVVGREFFVHLVADFPRIERRLPGLRFWPGRGKGKPESRSQVRKRESLSE